MFSKRFLTNNVKSLLINTNSMTNINTNSIKNTNNLTLLTNGQYYYYNMLKLSYNKVLLTDGPYNCGKTFIGTYYGYEMLNTKLIDRFVIIQPDSKSHWQKNYIDIYKKYFGEDKLTRFLYENKIEFLTSDRTCYNKYNNSFILADNMDKCTNEGLYNILQMVGINTRLLAIGNDVNKYNHNGWNAHTENKNGFELLQDMLHKKHIQRINEVKFTDNDIIEDNRIINELMNKL
jgi:hypothetical protein